MLLGRDRECRALDALLESVRGGESRVLVVRGDAGVGKSALLDYVAKRGSGFRLARAAGVQSEMELAFAGLHQLCAPMLGRRDRLPGPQRHALSVALGLTAGDLPSRFLVGLAVLGLLSEVAKEEPLVCLVDDAQWLDQVSLQVLEFVARRLSAESVALVFAVRSSADEQLMAGLPELVVRGLRDGDARALLASMIRSPVDVRIRDRIVAEARGNPLALLELPRGLSPAELAGGFSPQDRQTLSRRLEVSFQRRLALLPEDARRLLLVAAAEPLGEPMLVWTAAAQLGIGGEAADAAEASGLVDFGAHVTFRHPLVRSAIYRAASPQERRCAHGALAQVTGPYVDPDQRAWHLAQARSGPDEDVASELERSAARAHARGGLAAEAAFLERSVVLTADPARRASRALAAARAHAQAGAFDPALRLLGTAEAGPLEELEQAQGDLLRGQITFASSRGSDAPLLLLKAAKRLEPLETGLARETYLEALFAATYAGQPASHGGLREIAESVRAGPPSREPPGADDLLLDGLALLITDGPAPAAPMLKRAVRAFCLRDLSREQELRWLWLASTSAQRLWDDASWDVLSTRQVELARGAGALSVLPIALNQLAGLRLFTGDFAAAAALIEEAAVTAAATGGELPPYASLMLAAFRGVELGTTALIATRTNEMADRGEGAGVAFGHWVTAVLCNSLGHYEDAVAAAQQAREGPYELLFSTWAMVELIEAATRCGMLEQAAGAVEEFSDSARASGSDWALGLEACARALVSADASAEGMYREALDRLGASRVRWALARAHLLFGEWLRRARRRADAREELRTAHEMFVAMGAEAFAQRARSELMATGATARQGTGESNTNLTPQEAKIAGLAYDGLSNGEIAAQLFISPRTVQYHLRKVFVKLGITSRTQLARALTGDPGRVTDR
ncbi:MAG TPA: AAA family ATPase [Solirubrobacteraceae bacterium]|nr:AAA family ATPase [Solirubrobacteraceae bacterium]